MMFSVSAMNGLGGIVAKRRVNALMRGWLRGLRLLSANWRMSKVLLPIGPFFVLRLSHSALFTFFFLGRAFCRR